MCSFDMTIMTLREFLILFKLTERNVTITNVVLSHLSSGGASREKLTRSQETRAWASVASDQACQAPAVTAPGTVVYCERQL